MMKTELLNPIIEEQTGGVEVELLKTPASIKTVPDETQVKE